MVTHAPRRDHGPLGDPTQGLARAVGGDSVADGANFAPERAYYCGRPRHRRRRRLPQLKAKAAG